MFNPMYLVNPKIFEYKDYRTYLHYRYIGGNGAPTRLVGVITFTKHDYTWQHYLKLPIQLKAVKWILSKLDETFERARRQHGKH